MPRIQFDPELSECPNFTSPIYAAAHEPFINPNTTKEQAIQFLKDIWKAGNEADKVRWQQQNDEDAVALTEQRQLQLEADLLKVQARVDEEENFQKEEIKRNKSKYIPIPDRDVPTIAPVVTSNYTIRKMEKGLYVELCYYTNAGLDEASRSSNTANNKAMVMLQLPDGVISWVPAASARTTSGVVDDKDLPWEDFCQAAPQMIVAMEEANWPQDHVNAGQVLG
ncbi:hypothetical protein BYT27DRAFT_7208838 [Phlegmacium glaucopus]|nr:hypothetical protein BYT27DRAFT_7208838 [Phlegmacium glaucopus]